MTSSLANKIALVTGGCGGLGAAISNAFLKSGARVIAADINPKLIQSFRQCHESSPSAANLITQECDVTDAASRKDLFSAASKFDSSGQGIEIIVNNAAIMDRFDPVHTLDFSLFERIIAVNLRAPAEISKLAINAWIEHKIKGSIVNVASIAGVHGTRSGVAYTMAKHGLLGLTKNTAANYATLGIRCNAILPGAMDTGIASAWAEARSEQGWQATMRTMGMMQAFTPIEEVAALVVQLASRDAAAVNGACVPVDNAWGAH